MTETLPPLTAIPLGQVPIADPDSGPSWRRLGRRKPGRKTNAERAAAPAVGVQGPRQRRERVPARERTRETTPRSGSLETRIGAAIATINLIAAVIPATSRDALSPVEVTTLAKAVNAQCQTSPTFRKYIELALSASGAGGLIGVIAMIAARRAARHNLIPSMFDPMIGALMRDTAIPAPSPTPGGDVGQGQAPGIGGASPAPDIYSGQAPLPNLPPIGAPALPVEQAPNGEFNFETGSFAPAQ